MRELIAFHDLPGAAAAEVKRARSHAEWGPDPHLKELRKAVSLVKEAERLRWSRKYKEASEKCDEALECAPDYPSGLIQRSKVRLYFLSDDWRELSAADRAKYVRSAHADSLHCLEIYPEWSTASLWHLQNVILIADVESDQAVLRQTLRKLDEDVLGAVRSVEPLTDHDRGLAFSLRAECRNSLGEAEIARKDFDESIRLAPKEPIVYLNRARYWERLGRLDLADADRRTSESRFRDRQANP